MVKKKVKKFSDFIISSNGQGPSEPRNLRVEDFGSTAVTISWEIPLVTNGRIKKYEVLYVEQDKTTGTVSV